MQIKRYFTFIIGSIISSLFVYFVLSSLFVDSKISICISVTISILVFALSRYYSNSQENVTLTRPEKVSTLDGDENNYFYHADVKDENSSLSPIIFAIIFASIIIISSISYKEDFHVFINWNEVSSIAFIHLAAAIMLCFFVPGYSIVLILTKKYKINPILKVLLAYILSILITGLTAYVSAMSFDIGISEGKDIFILVYVFVLASFLIVHLGHKISFRPRIHKKIIFHLDFISNTVTNLKNYAKSTVSELLVFASLFALIIILVYLVYGGVTIGDQWYHQGRALLFMSGAIREAVVSGAEAYYPPFQSALLAALTTLSGVPLVNAYASIAFLNAMPMFAFYYFFSTWVPLNLKKSSLIACSLFTLAAGYGWIYLLNWIPVHPIISAESSLNTLGSMADLDIISATNFVIPTAPDFSTALIYIALPAGFILLALIRKSFHSRSLNITLVTAVSLLGILAHYEFYIFIIVACFLPPIFKMTKKSCTYASLLFGIFIVYLMDVTIPGYFFTSETILGIPLLLLSGVFVMITWTIYLLLPYLHKILQPTITSLNLSKSLLQNKRAKFLTATVIIFLIAYVYLFSFIVLGQLSLTTIREHGYQNNIPWYLYPMKFGVMGLLGLAFVLSYFFKRFEKHVFIFGIIIIISLITGPYYDEGRLNKYAMVGFIGFSSLMIYYILNWSFYNNPIRNVILIGVIITFSGLSTMIFIGYSSLIVQTQDFSNTLSRRHFPPPSEMHLFEVLHNISDTNSGKYNILSYANQYDRRLDGIMAKVPSFAGLPYDKLRQSPLALNASTLDALYRHLDYSDAKYILLPKSSIRGENSTSSPTIFAIENFKQVYQDKNYTLLEVPPLRPPTSSSNGHVAILYNNNPELLPLASINGTRILAFTNKTYNFNAKDASIVTRKDNQSNGLVILGSMRPNETTVWTKIINGQPKINSFEVPFRIISKDTNKSNSFIGLKWQEGNWQYFIKLSSTGLALYQKNINNQSYKILVNNSEIEKKGSIGYTVKVQSLNNSVNIYLNDVLKIKASKDKGNNTSEGIAKIGLSSLNNDVEFEPVKIWNVSKSLEQINNKYRYYDYYYPLSMLALAKTNYDIFRPGDLSVFSKDIIILPDNYLFDNNTFTKYLDYVRDGGTLVAINSDNKFNETFSRLFPIEYNKTTSESFSAIASTKNGNLAEIPGTVNKLQVKPSTNLEVTAWYQNNKSQMIVPFAIEKILSKGKIVLINAEPYFNSISHSPRKYFSSLSNISKLLHLEAGQDTYSNTSLSLPGIIGNMEASGQIKVNSSSLFLANGDSYPYLLNASRVKVINGTGNSRYSFDNLIIKDLKLAGDYNASINLSGTVKLPGMNSDHNYISMFAPSGFNMTVQLNPKRYASAEIFTQNETVNNRILVGNNSKITFYNIKTVPPLGFVPLLLKNPEVMVNGHVSINNANLDGYLTGRGALYDGLKLDFNGHVVTKFDLADHYNQDYRSGIRIKYISYLDNFLMNGTVNQQGQRLKLPGAIPDNAINHGHDLPLNKILSSSINIVALIGLIIATLVGIWLIKKFNPKILNHS